MKGPAVRLMLVAIVAVAAAVTLLPRVGAFREPPPTREIRLVARDMTFYVDGDRSPNPTIRVQAGERIRVVLRNEDPGMTHDLAIEAWQVATRTLSAKGAEDSFEIRVPDRPGAIPYQCTPHAVMMKGTISVE